VAGIVTTGVVRRTGAATWSASAIATSDLPTTGLNIASHYGVITSDSPGATIQIDLSVSDKHTITLGAAANALSVVNDHDGQTFMVILVQDGTGSRTVTWWSGIKWPGGTVPTLTMTLNKTDVFTFIRTGSGAYLGFPSGLNL
jgi:hypothetical protein